MTLILAVYVGWWAVFALIWAAYAARRNAPRLDRKRPTSESFNRTT